MFSRDDRKDRPVGLRLTDDERKWLERVQKICKLGTLSDVLRAALEFSFHNQEAFLESIRRDNGR